MEEKIIAALEKVGAGAPSVVDNGDTIVLTYEAANYARRVSKDMDAIGRIAKVVASTMRDEFNVIAGRPVPVASKPVRFVVTLTVKPLPTNASK